MAKPALTREYIEEQFKLGLTARAIEEKLGMKQNTLAYHLKKWGISNPNPRKKNQPPTVLQEAKEQLRDVQPPDPVNNPQHYTFGGIETIDYIQAKLGPEGFQAFCLGNVLKYCSRHNHKGGMEDLRKARWYLDRIIQAEKVN
ncbi:DUF3310 domain-containing protein [Paenibacillus hubeiensis]|uniref:DUF3310 domain-containing protein n=1 Tax=Paenibacillus hubeiensis TaxID=3077330 RepID=UPI0031B9FD2E